MCMSDFKDPQVRQLVERMKWEIAQELGIQLPEDGYWGHLSAQDCGRIGQLLKKRVPLILSLQENHTEQD